MRKALENEPGVITNLKAEWLGWKNNTTYACYAREGLCEYLRRHVGEVAWRDAFTFAFIRNPFDRAVSNWKYFSRLGMMSGSFEQYVEMITVERPQYSVADLQHTALLWHAETQWFQIFNKSGTQMVDFVGRFESLPADFQEICRRLNVSNAALPHLNKSNHNHYRSYYSARTERLIASRYEKDIEEFGYCF